MGIFDLLFIACFLGTLGYGGAIAVLALRRRWLAVRRHGLRLASAWGVYFVVLLAVGALSPQRILAPDQFLQYDDWCIGVKKTAFADALDEVRPQAGNRFAIVTLQIRSTARRVRQRAPAGSLVYLLDEAEARYDVSAPAQAAFEKTAGLQPELTTQLDPGGSLETTRVFEVPRAAPALFLAHRHGTGFPFPGLFIIGESARGPKVIRLAWP